MFFFCVKIDNFCGKNQTIWIFAPKLVKNCHYVILFKAIFGRIHDFWPKSSNIWYILESKIEEYYWILAQKFKIRWFARCRQNSIFGRNSKIWLLTQCGFDVECLKIGNESYLHYSSFTVLKLGEFSHLKPVF